MQIFDFYFAYIKIAIAVDLIAIALVLSALVSLGYWASKRLAK